MKFNKRNLQNKLIQLIVSLRHKIEMIQIKLNRSRKYIPPAFTLLWCPCLRENTTTLVLIGLFTL
jgi:hypothetical protein